MASLKYGNIVKKTWPLMLYNFAVAQFVSAEFINLLVISGMIWPGDSFHAFEMGAMVSVRLWVDGFSALFWGHFADRFSRKKLISVASLFSCFFVLINGFMPIGNGSSSYIFWLINHGLIGLCMAGGGPNINSLISDILDKGERSQFFGLTSIVWRVTGVFSTILGALFFQIGLWRQYYWYCSIPFIILFIIFSFRFSEPKRGIQEKALKGILKDDNIEYNYKLSKETLRSTVFSKTNILILFEGIFSGIFFGVLDLVLLPYIQSPPRNISPINSSLFMLIFGIPGALVGTLIFSKISDKYGAKNIKNRITLIIIALSTAFIMVFGLFFIPLPSLSIEEGKDLTILFIYPIFLILGIIVFFSSFIMAIFAVNQPPIIQEINLPEAQGTIASWNQLVEVAGYGSGPIIGGYFLQTLNNNYAGTIGRVIGLGIPGIIMWIVTYWTINGDRKRIRDILDERAAELTELQEND